MNRSLKSLFVSTAFALFALFSSTTAHAADGCKFLLCITGPWSSISQCVPTVQEVFRDVARGRGIPTCDMGGEGNSAVNNWVDEASCPSMWKMYGGENMTYVGCMYPARISVYVTGQLWSQVFWTTSGQTATFYSERAIAALTSQAGSLPLDQTFSNELTAWNSARVSSCVGGTLAYDSFGAVLSCTMPETGGNGG